MVKRLFIVCPKCGSKRLQVTTTCSYDREFDSNGKLIYKRINFTDAGSTSCLDCRHFEVN